MTTQKDIDRLLGIGKTSNYEQNVVPEFLVSRYDKLGAIENIRDARICNPSVAAALIRVLIVDDEDEIRDSAISVLCEICEETYIKRIALLIAAMDQSYGVLTTVLEQANILDDDIALQIASKLMDHEDSMISSYAKAMIERLNRS